MILFRALAGLGGGRFVMNRGSGYGCSCPGKYVGSRKGQKHNKKRNQGSQGLADRNLCAD
eukprot:633436-Amphidinium_carterae.1